MFEGWCASEVLWFALSVEAGDGHPCHSKDERVIDVLETTKVPESGHIGIRSCPSRKAVGSVAHVHPCLQHGQQTGDAGSRCAVREL